MAEIHPDTASAYGIRSGDEVSIETCKGSIRQLARVTTRIRPGIVNAAYGWWFPEDDSEESIFRSNANAIMDDDLSICDSVSGGYIMRGQRCKVYKDESQ